MRLSSRYNLSGVARGQSKSQFRGFSGIEGVARRLAASFRQQQFRGFSGIKPAGNISFPGLRTSPSCAAHSCAREARSGTPAAVLHPGAYRLSKLWQHLLFVSLALLLLVTGCKSADSSAVSVAPGSEISEERVPEVLQELPTEAESEPEPEPFYCPFCGTKIPGDSIYCLKCGKKIEDFGKEEPWHAPESLDELIGVWTGESDVIITYPDFSLDNGDRMLSFAWPEVDATYDWHEYAETYGLTVSSMWSKKNAYRAAICGDIRSDENGSQLGVFVRRESDGTIYAQQKLFVAEKIVRDNSTFFLISPDGDKLKTNGIFRLFSSLNYSVKGSGLVYTKGDE